MALTWVSLLFQPYSFFRRTKVLVLFISGVCNYALSPCLQQHESDLGTTATTTIIRASAEITTTLTVHGGYVNVVCHIRSTHRTCPYCRRYLEKKLRRYWFSSSSTVFLTVARSPLFRRSERVGADAGQSRWYRLLLIGVLAPVGRVDIAVVVQIV